jgi:hypothetical protein
MTVHVSRFILCDLAVVDALLWTDPHSNYSYGVFKTKFFHIFSTCSGALIYEGRIRKTARKRVKRVRAEEVEEEQNNEKKG